MERYGITKQQRERVKGNKNGRHQRCVKREQSESLNEIWLSIHGKRHWMLLYGTFTLSPIDVKSIPCTSDIVTFPRNIDANVQLRLRLRCLASKIRNVYRKCDFIKCSSFHIRNWCIKEGNEEESERKKTKIAKKIAFENATKKSPFLRSGVIRYINIFFMLH